MTSKFKAVLALMALSLSACGGGVNAGGETPTSNGGVAFIALTGMLILTGLILWIFLGRDD